MDVETSYTFDGNDKVSDVADFLRERHMESGGWDLSGQGPDVNAPDLDKFGPYSSGNLRLVMVEHIDDDED